MNKIWNGIAFFGIVFLVYSAIIVLEIQPIDPTIRIAKVAELMSWGLLWVYFWAGFAGVISGLLMAFVIIEEIGFGILFWGIIGLFLGILAYDAQALLYVAEWHVALLGILGLIILSVISGFITLIITAWGFD